MFSSWRDVIGLWLHERFLTLRRRVRHAAGEHTGIAWTLFALNLSGFDGWLDVHLCQRGEGRSEGSFAVRALSAYRDRTHEAAIRAMWAGRVQDARDGFRRAALYASQASSRCRDRESKALNQAKAWSSYERYRALAPFPVRRLMWKSLGCGGYLHVPAADGRYPVLLLFPDDFSLKEDLCHLVDAGLEEGIAVLTLDPPGWQVSSESGWRAAEDWAALMAEVVECLRQEEQVDETRMAAAGMLTGAFWAFLAALLEPSIRFVSAVAPVLPFPDGVGLDREADSHHLTDCILKHACCTSQADYQRQWEQLLAAALTRPAGHDQSIFLHSCRGDFEGELPTLVGGVDLFHRFEPGVDLDRWMIEGGFKRMWMPTMEWLAVQFRLRVQLHVGGGSPPLPCTATL